MQGYSLTDIQTLQPNVIADIMFLHERGTYNTLYFAFYFASIAVSTEPAVWCAEILTLQ